MNETTALTALIAASRGRATVEPVTALAIAIMSPWRGDRRGVRDRPDTAAPADARELLRFMAEVQTQLSSKPLPRDRGLLAWLRHHERAVPIREIERMPGWLADPLLADGWLALPPAGRYVAVEDWLSIDARLAFLHILARQAGGPDAPRPAVTTLAEWFVGIRNADASLSAHEQCSVMQVNHTQEWAWEGSVQQVPVDKVVDQLTGTAVVADDWTAPPPTAAELAAEEDRKRIIAEGEKATAEWNARYRVANRAVPAGRSS